MTEDLLRRDFKVQKIRILLLNIEGMNYMLLKSINYCINTFINFIFNVLPSLFLFYLFLPIQSMDNTVAYYIMSFVNYFVFFFAMKFLVKVVKSFFTWKCWLYGFIFLVGFIIYQDYIKVMIFFGIIMAVKLIIIILVKLRLKMKPHFKGLLIIPLYFIDLLMFFSIMLIVISVIENKFPFLLKYENLIVVGLVFIITVFFSFYIFKVSIDILENSNKILYEGKDNKFTLPLIVFVPLFLLLLPDLVYGYFIYDIEFNVLNEIDNEKVDAVTRIYFAISAHFNLSLYDSIPKGFNTELRINVSNFIRICQAVLNRLIEIVIIGTIVGLFVEYFKESKRENTDRI